MHQLICFPSNYKNVDFILKSSRSGFNTLVAAVITIPHQSEISHIEYPDYRKYLITMCSRSINSGNSFVLFIWWLNFCLLAWEQFLSDVGGAAGLVLGISLATIFGVFDCSTIILINCCRIVCRHLIHSISDRTEMMIQRTDPKRPENLDHRIWCTFFP